MRTLIILSVILISIKSKSQSTSDLVEGGKTLVELIKAFKPAKVAGASPATASYADSCSIKRQASISFYNKLGDLVLVSLYFRIGSAYDAQPLTLRISAATKETLYDIRSGIYKYKIETETSGVRTTLHEGELRLQPCETAARDVKN